MDKLKKPDHIAALLGAALTILSTLHVPEKLGITVDELGIMLGAIVTFAASVRARLGSKAAVGAVLLVLVGCVPYTPPPAAPDWNGCDPSESFYVDLARSEDALVRPETVPTDPKLAAEKAERMLNARGFKIVTRSELPKWLRKQADKWLDKTAITLPGFVVVKDEVNEWPMPQQARLRYHELAHADQMLEFGPWNVAAMYVPIPFVGDAGSIGETAHGRAALELAAVRQERMVARRLGLPTRPIADQAADMYESYYLGPEGMPEECFLALAEELWVKD